MRSDRVGYVVSGATLIAWALRKPSLSRAALAGLGGWLLYQAFTGSTPVLKPLGISVNREPRETGLAETVVIEEAITIGRPRAEVYAFWQRQDNLPLAGDGEIVITHEAAGEELGWRVTDGERLVRFGWITLRDAPGGKATFVAAHVEYAPVGGSLGAALSLVTGHSPRQLVTDCLRSARSQLEIPNNLRNDLPSGEVPGRG